MTCQVRSEVLQLCVSARSSCVKTYTLSCFVFESTESTQVVFASRCHWDLLEEDEVAVIASSPPLRWFWSLLDCIFVILSEIDAAGQRGRWDKHSRGLGVLCGRGTDR